MKEVKSKREADISVAEIHLLIDKVVKDLQKIQRKTLRLLINKSK